MYELVAMVNFPEVGTFSVMNVVLVRVSTVTSGVVYRREEVFYPHFYRIDFTLTL